jgi:predicted nucleotidyltransferase
VHPTSAVPALAEEIAARFGESSRVVAVALGGSRVTGLADERSDVDLYVYARQPIPIPVREAIVGLRSASVS